MHCVHALMDFTVFCVYVDEIIRLKVKFCNSKPKAACDKLVLAHFPCSQRGVDIGEHRPSTEKEIIRLGFSSHFQN